MSVSIRSQRKSGDVYSVQLDLNIDGDTICISIDCLSKPVSSVRVDKRGEFLYLELLDDTGKGFATCVIDMGHLTKKCLQCRSLLVPP